MYYILTNLNPEALEVEKFFDCSISENNKTCIFLGPLRLKKILYFRSLQGRLSNFAPVFNLSSYLLIFLFFIKALPVVWGAKNIERIIRFEYRGVRCGQFVVASLNRSFRASCISVFGLKTRLLLCFRLAKSMALSVRAYKLAAVEGCDGIFVVDRCYSPAGEFFDAFINRGLSVISWNKAHKDNHLILKKYDEYNRNLHPSSLSFTSFQKIRAHRDIQSMRVEVLRELESCYRNGSWYSEVGTQFLVKSQSKSDVENSLDLSERFRVGVFPHIFWDATFFGGDDLFDNYEDWFKAVLEVAKVKSDVDWIIKIHPGNLVKDSRDGRSGVPSEILTIYEMFQELPPHIKLLPPETEISSWDLLHVIDCCLTVRGTIGLEAAALGVPSLLAGSGRYDKFGFTHNFSTKNDYISRLLEVDSVARLTDDQHSNAIAYAYGLFINRPFALKTLTLQRETNKVANLRVFRDFCWKNPILRADAKDFFNWLQDDSEDYLNLKNADNLEPI